VASERYGGQSGEQAEAAVSDLDPASKEVLKTATQVMLRPAAQVIEDAIGILGGDALSAYRQRQNVRRQQRQEQLGERTILLLNARGVDELVEPNEPMVEAILEAAQDENSVELQDLWARLLAAAIAPSRSGNLRYAYIETVKKFEPLDAATLRYIKDVSAKAHIVSTAQYLAEHMTLGRSRDEYAVSLEHLHALNCLSYPATEARFNPWGNVHLTPYGRELLRTID
jgi:hypothetical protein